MSRFRIVSKTSVQNKIATRLPHACEQFYELSRQAAPTFQNVLAIVLVILGTEDRLIRFVLQSVKAYNVKVFDTTTLMKTN